MATSLLLRAASPPRLAAAAKPAAAASPAAAAAQLLDGGCSSDASAALTKQPASRSSCRSMPQQPSCKDLELRLRHRHKSQVFEEPASPAGSDSPSRSSSSSTTSLTPPVITGLGPRFVQSAADGLDTAVREFLTAAVDVNQLHKIEGHYYPVTALMMAAIGGHLVVIQLLVDAGADTEVPSRYGTALDMACRMEQLASLSMLAAAGASLEKKDARGQTRLMQAVTRGKVDVVRALLHAGASTETRDDHATPFIAACIRGHDSVVFELVRAGCDVTATDDDDGATGMELASLLGHHQVVDLLQQLASQEPAPAKQLCRPDAVPAAAEPEPEPEPEPEAELVFHRTVIHRFGNSVVEVAPGDTIKRPLVRLAPRGSWSLRRRDEEAAELPPPSAISGTILNLLTGRPARGAF